MIVEREWLRQMLLLLTAVVIFALTGCRGGQDAAANQDHEAEAEILTLPVLEPVTLDGGKLRVVATTDIIGDVVAQVGGEAIDLTTLMAAGEDPHSFEPGARALTAVANAHVTFVHGWNLEEGLVDDLEAIGENAPVVPVAANIEPLKLGAHENESDHADEHEDDHNHTGVNPHTWLDPHLVKQWVENVEQVLVALDPANAETYRRNASAYQTELDDLLAYYDAQISAIPAAQRKLVTNHDAFSYFATAYDFEIVGTVLPAASTLAEPSASGLAELVEVMENEGVCTIFAETTANARVAGTVAGELDGCDDVKVLALHTGALGPDGSGADSYIGMMRSNVEAIVNGLR